MCMLSKANARLLYIGGAGVAIKVLLVKTLFLLMAILLALRHVG